MSTARTTTTTTTEPVPYTMNERLSMSMNDGFKAIHALRDAAAQYDQAAALAFHDKNFSLGQNLAKTAETLRSLMEQAHKSIVF